jgi:hypothetical protein
MFKQTQSMPRTDHHHFLSAHSCPSLEVGLYYVPHHKIQFTGLQNHDTCAQRVPLVETTIIRAPIFACLMS